MRAAILFVVLACGGSLAEYADRRCPCTFENIWLDVVVVVDTSAGMTQDGVVQISATIASVFGSTRIGPNNSNDPRYTRIGLVTYANTAIINSDLLKYKTTDDFVEDLFSVLQVTTIEESILEKGLYAAESVLVSSRNATQKVVIVFASSYRSDGENNPVPTAMRLRQSGVTLITIAYDQTGDSMMIRKIGDLATPGNAFTNTDLNLVGEIVNALCAANCFCPDLWRQLTSEFGNTAAAYKLGSCLRLSEIPAMWTSAKFACRNMHRSGFLATEFTQEKHTYLLEMMKHDAVQSEPYAYHIGLSYVNGAYNWEQPVGYQLEPVSPT
ncbi:unnamed protein product [Caenorhabditis bovis]|uniref:VWFA domain-containing protein n=1 Tax=Caenorhabditis bovis TaxID=2654633 RepID=A0A8S1EZ41_9PELO|nr:unnamed protein product [Caenorhabditis bovis]CAB3405475.1 unnamed protein product [Caenorhabditis bovis]